MTINAWRDPWVRVRSAGGDHEVSLRELYAEAHNLRTLGPGYTPLDMDSFLRFLPAVGAEILKRADDSEDFTDGRYPLEAVEKFESEFDLTLFDLAGERPFLQRWDRTPADIERAAAARKLALAPDGTRKAALRPMDQIHPHEPGTSSSQWAIRRDARDATHPIIIMNLLVTCWFQTKNGNSKDIFGAAATKGSTGTWHVNPFAAFFVDENNLGRTLLANTPAEWLDGDSVPAFFDRDQDVPGFSGHPLDLYRCTYAKSLPLVYFEDGAAVGFISGADEFVPVPALGGDDKESLGLVHAHDHTRLYVTDTKKGTITPRGSFGVRISSVEGFDQWFREDRKTDESLRSLRDITRLVDVAEGDDWTLALFSERTDGKGNRSWCDWSTIPLNVAGADPLARAAFVPLLGILSKALAFAYHAMKTVTGAKKSAEATDQVKATIMTAAQPHVTSAMHSLASDPGTVMRPYADEIVRAAIRTFEAATDPYVTAQNMAEVALARSNFARQSRSVIKTVYLEGDTQ